MATLRRGNEGEQVARLQALLCLGDYNAKPIDGDFGPGTERAVRACYQHTHLGARVRHGASMYIEYKGYPLRITKCQQY